MKRCDKFILSSNREGLPTVLIEALSVNDVVISSNCKSGPNEILDNGKIGYLFEVGDYNELARLMIEAKPVEREFIEKGIDKFSYQNIMKEFSKIIN